MGLETIKSFKPFLPTCQFLFYLSKHISEFRLCPRHHCHFGVKHHKGSKDTPLHHTYAFLLLSFFFIFYVIVLTVPANFCSFLS